MGTVDEFALIRLLTGGKQSTAFQREGGVETGIGDDAAVVNVNPGTQLILTCDTMTEDIHFKPVTMRSRDIGFKAMASAVSDIAAMGGKPRFALVALSLPRQTPLERVRSLYEGLYDCANRYGVRVVGGDTTSSIGGMTVSVTVIGETAAGQALLRSSAKVGDVVFATGYLGRSAAGLDWLLQRNLPLEPEGADAESLAYAKLVEAHCRPLPQIEAGLALRQSGLCRALNDVSDGLSSEAWEIAEASGVGIDLIEERIPIADELYTYAAASGKDPLDYVLYGGEDYELLGTAPAEHALELQIALGKAGVSLHLIGYVNGEHSGVRLIRSGGEVMPLDKKGYNHFNDVGGKDGV
ncbi:thiamine-phosphate kinase [Paenibacillus validus]|uniref:Thiamine-monophosphate kinase n=1 Tax=Paenibacillus validus TaxID=44253 RepID=A0A7X2ZBV6_9BACL|nr:MULTISPECIES: thiamine-phosphate kinase [Paenibacillus]MED4602888.1 thiamine-phosphate kinase [Paenibacillus validus]MED4607174.1 thiamine-phosphate kinase [Paenibacillus validus]MUG72105.1 thiamine-phosphate kinase [Paenibacillus validus]